MGSKKNVVEFETIEEETVKCLFFPVYPENNKQYWQVLASRINDVIESMASEYIWHKDKLNVFVPLHSEVHEDLPDHLYSLTCFGENIEDEWFIFYLIMEISKIMDSLIIQIFDSDGEFLLIEAADFLPSWMNPVTTVNRVFILNGDIHILPPDIVDLKTKLSVKESITYLIKHKESTKAHRDIQRAVLKRIENYPQNLKEYKYTANVTLPIEIAGLLKMQPSLISPIVSAYVNHDVMDAKNFKNVDGLYKESVKVGITFTKFLYAMLMHCKVSKSLIQKFASEMDKSSIIGLKLACGYNVLTSRPRDIYMSKDYNSFIQNLKEKGYFKENLEGSKDYSSLLTQAKEYFASVLSPRSDSLYENIRSSMATDEFKKTVSFLRNTEEGFMEDSDDWLNVQPDYLNKILEDRYGKEAKFKNNDTSPNAVTNHLSHFLKKSSDYEGIEFVENDNEADIDFDGEEFSDALKKILNIVAKEDGASTDDTDYSISDEDNDPDIQDMHLQNELQESLASDLIGETMNPNKAFSNILQSLKEEKGSSGPSSNLLRSIGIAKNDLLDSDDDDDDE